MKDEAKTKEQLITELNELRLQSKMQPDSGHKKPEGDLRTRHIGLSSILKLIPVPILITSLSDSLIIDVNTAWQEVTGLSRDEIIGHTTKELNIYVNINDREYLYEEIREKGNIRNFALQLRHKSGNVSYMLMSAELIELGGEQCLLSIAQDITDRSMLEEALRKSEYRFRLLAENAKDIIYRMSLTEGKYEYLSPSVFIVTGYTPEEHYQEPQLFKKMIHPDSADYFEREWHNLLKGEMPPFYEFQIINKYGESKWINQRNTLIRDTNGTPLAIEGIASDITDRKQMEGKLRDTLSFLHTLFNTIPSPIFCKNISCLYVDCNKEFERYTGFERKDIIGKSVYDMYSQDIADKYHEMDLALFRQPGKQIYEYPIIYADGNRHDVVVNKATYQNADGAVAGLVGVMVDITDRKQTENELVRYREGLEILVQERTQDLENKTKALEEASIAFKLLLQHREEDKKDLEDRFVMNINNLIIPFAEKMKGTNLDERQLAYLNIIEAHLSEISSSMIKKMLQFNFTPTEVEVASLIKQGKTSKEIAMIMGIATGSIDTHRNHIRKKLGISKKNVNLLSRLDSLG